MDLTLLNVIPDLTGAYLVGGSVRDLLLGKSPSDYDIAVSGNPESFAESIVSNSMGRIVKLGKQNQIIYRVVTKKHTFDIASINGAGIDEDLHLRDFTINAMAYDLSSGKLIDLSGGRKDLAAGCVRMVSAECFVRDPVRLIRAFRFAALLKFAVEPETLSAIRRYAHLISNSAGERIRDEYFKILNTPESFKYICAMDAVGLLDEIFPEFTPLKACRQNRYHIHDAFTHSLYGLQHLEQIINGSDQTVPFRLKQIIKSIDAEKAALFKHAMLLHDIGKPRTKTIDKRGHIHFYRHDEHGADMAQIINTRLRLSTRRRNLIDRMIRFHLQPLHLFNAYSRNTLTSKGIIRFFMKHQTSVPNLLLHFMADTKAKAGKNLPEALEFCNYLLHRYQDDFIPLKSVRPLLTGRDLIEELNLAPSPLFQQILTRVEEQRLLKKLTVKSEALSFAHRMAESLNRVTGEGKVSSRQEAVGSGQ